MSRHWIVWARRAGSAGPGRRHLAAGNATHCRCAIASPGGGYPVAHAAGRAVGWMREILWRGAQRSAGTGWPGIFWIELVAPAWNLTTPGLITQMKLDSSVLGAETTAWVALSAIESGPCRRHAGQQYRRMRYRVGVGLSVPGNWVPRDRLKVGVGVNQEEPGIAASWRAVGTPGCGKDCRHYGLTSRDQLSWSIEQRAYGTRYGHNLGGGGQRHRGSI